MNDDRALGDQPADLLFDEVQPQDALAERAIDVARTDRGWSFAARAKYAASRARSSIGSSTPTTPLAIARQAHPELDDPRKRAAVERRAAPLGPRQRAHPRGIVARGLTSASTTGRISALTLNSSANSGS